MISDLIVLGLVFICAGAKDQNVTSEWKTEAYDAVAGASGPPIESYRGKSNYKSHLLHSIILSLGPAGDRGKNKTKKRPWELRR